jgi:hypothetical protein
MQDYHAGRFWYDTQLLPEEPKFQLIFHEVWKTFFTPSAAVRKRLEDAMSTMGLIPHQYVGAHCRVLYGMDDRPEKIKRNWATNAINCASQMKPSWSIFFTSDSANATYYAEQYGREKGAHIATRVPDPNPPLHIEFDGGRHRPATDYLDGFVDLYILAQAECVTYNKGGYGYLGLLMSRNSTCEFRQDAINRPRIHDPCHWTVAHGSSSNNSSSIPSKDSTSSIIVEPTYLEPIAN